MNEVTPKGHLADNYLTIEDLSKVLRRSVAAIYTQRSRNPRALPPAIKGTKPLLWCRETVEQWLKEREEVPPPAPKRRGRPRGFSESAVS